jgi:hypothetical protein
MAAILAIPPADIPPEKDMAAGLQKYLFENKQGTNHLASFRPE